MSLVIAAYAAGLFLIYAAIGIAFGVWFAASGVGKLDSAATHAPWSFRLIVMPGAAALWPLLLKRCLSRRSHSENPQ